MILPPDYKEMSNEELLEELTKIYGSEEAANYIFLSLRGTVKPSQPLE
jgi:hypothetical protein